MSSRVQYYSDEKIDVIAPSIQDVVQASESTSFSATYVADVLSGATAVVTADAVSSATTFSEVRHQGALSITQDLGEERSVSGNYGISLEPDHVSHSVGIVLSAEILDAMATPSIGYLLNAEFVGMTDDPEFDERSLTHQVDLRWTHILTTQATISVLATGFAATCDARIGCRANPYRFLRVPTEQATLVLRERHPNLRIGGAGAVRLAYALGEESALQGGYRWFCDSWRVDGHTADLAYVSEFFSGKLFIRAQIRTTLQGAARFYQSAYSADAMEMPRYRTADAELSRLSNLIVDGHADWQLGALGPFSDLVLALGAGRMWMHYPDFHSLPKRHALLLSVGLNTEF